MSLSGLSCELASAVSRQGQDSTCHTPAVTRCGEDASEGMMLYTCVPPGDSHLPDGAVGLPFSAFLTLSNLAKISLKAEGVTNDSPSLIASWIWEGTDVGCMEPTILGH